MGTLALLRPHDPLSLASFRRLPVGSPQARTHPGTSPPSKVFCSGGSCRKTQLPNLSCALPSRRSHQIARRETVVRSGIAAATTSSPEFSAHPLTESQAGSRIRGACFYAVTAVSAIFLFMAMVVLHPFVLLFDRVEFEGLEKLLPDDVAAVYVSNHQSFLDIYTLLTLGKSFKFISKRGVFLFPIIGWAMFLLGTIPLRRVDTRSQLVLA